MRIIAGRFGGRKLASPQDQSVRPTSDRVREAVFSILTSSMEHDFSGLRVLDLFAGTGALGLEALSRGASFAIFVDNGVQARAIIRDHIESFGLGGESKLLRRDATALGPAGGFFASNLVFLDPPYGQGLGEKALLSARDGGWLASGAIIVLEERKGAEINVPDGFTRLDQRRYASTGVSFFALGGASAWGR